jgi:TrmH family RNA methyltransferase
MRDEFMVRIDEISVAFVEPESPGNIGFLARTMKNFGLANLILVGGCNLGEDAWTTAMHAKEVIKRSRRVNWRELMEMGFDFYIGTTSRQGHDSNLPRMAIDPCELGKSLIEVQGRICIIMGREGNGLNRNELEICDVVVTIPASPEYPALNITHAAAIVFYEIFKNLGKTETTRMRAANAKEKETLLRSVDLMIESSELPEHRKKSSKLVFRRMVNRAFISGRECHTLIGLMKELSGTEGGRSQPRPP